MSVIMVSHIANKSTVCSTAVIANKKVDIKTPHYSTCVRGIHQWLVDSPHKGPVIWKTFIFHDIIMKLHIVIYTTIKHDILPWWPWQFPVYQHVVPCITGIQVANTFGWYFILCTDKPWISFHKEFMSWKSKSCEKSSVVLIIKSRRGCNFAHGMTAEPSCHVQNYNLSE